MFKKSDYIIISIICFFLGIFLISQYYSGKEYNKLIQPENNSVLALEVAKLTKSNANLRREVQDLTVNLESYRNFSESSKKAYNQYLNDSERYDIINGIKPVKGQGVIISINGHLSATQVVDLFNAIKNIGGEIIGVNGKRLIINSDMSQFIELPNYEIKVLGNSTLLKSAIERKGGIIEQIENKEINFSINESNNIEIGSTFEIKFKYARIIDETK